MQLTNILLFLSGLGGMEVALIIVALLLFFGAKRIPELAKGLGRGIREFKDASQEMKNDFEKNISQDKPQASETEVKLRA